MAPPSVCPTEEAFQDSLRSRLGNDPFADQGLVVIVRISRDDGEAYIGRLSIVARVDEPTLERVIRSDGEGCEPLAEALAMTLSVILDPTAGLLPTLEPEVETENSSSPPSEIEPLDLSAEPPSLPPNEATTRRPSEMQEADVERPRERAQQPIDHEVAEEPRLRVVLFPILGLRLGLGRGPGLTLGPVAGVGVSLNQFSLSLRGRTDFTVADFLVKTEQEVDVTLISGGMNACFSLSLLDICVTGDIGGLLARPSPGDLRAELTGFLGCDLGIEFSLGRTALRILLGLEFALVRMTVYVDDVLAWRSPLVMGHLGFEVKFDFDVTGSRGSSHVPVETP